MKLSVPFLLWRDGRPRWNPSPSLRPDWHGQDLKDEAGRWLSLSEAIAAAEAINNDVAAWRAKGRPMRSAPAARTFHTCRQCWEKLTDEPKWKLRLAEKTKAEYTKMAGIFLASEFGDEPVRAVTRPQLIAYYNELVEARGLAMANHVLAVVSIIFSHAERLGWRPEESNPAFHMDRISCEPRTVLWTPRQCERVVAVADRIGHAGVGDAVVLALHTAQRQGDVLRMTEPDVVGTKLRFSLTQSKRQARVGVPATAALTRRIEAIRRRRQSADVVALHNAGPIVRRNDGVAYADRDASQFGKDWREVRRIAALGDAARGEEPMPEILTKLFLDFRDTAVTRLALAECTLAEIRAISGHSLETITTVLKHYLVMDEAMADGAIGKLQIWMEKEGIAV